jgi:hypothetical protein
MILSFLKDWQGAVTVNGVEYANPNAVPPNLALDGSLSVILHPCEKTAQKASEGRVEQPVHKLTDVEMSAKKKYRIKVKSYMTKPASPNFDFMAKWNDNKPMPLRVMVGEMIKETRGMVYMVLHGDILAERTMTCMKCGRPITNEVSQFFGLGPECGGHSYTNPFNSEAELKEAVEVYRKQLHKTVWEGWVIRSAIEELSEIY